MQHNLDNVTNAYAEHLRAMNYESAIQLSRALRAAGQADEAIHLLERWADRAENAMQRAQLGIDMNFLGMFERAEPLLKDAVSDLSSDTDVYIANSELAISQYSLGKFHEAHRLFRALRDKDGCSTLVRYLYHGQTEDQIKWIEDKVPSLSESLAGKRVAIVMEGGVGDLIMYARYLQAMKEEGAHAVYFLAARSLHGVLKSDDCIRVVEDTSAAMRECDYITWTFNLFARYQRNPYFPSVADAYIEPPANHELPPHVQACLDQGSGRFRVGVIWRSSTGVRHEPFRSVELSKLEVLLQSRACRFFSLQMDGLSPDEHALLERHEAIDLGTHIQSFSDTAHILRQLDLLIAIDTGPVHLAGALGRPVWLLLSQACDSRWYDCQRFTPWYASMRLFRQRRLGDWSTPLEEMARSLACESSSA
ncbi:glycosyltransferase family 9 protein [Trinickia violacea]|uniref:Glycosyltransferase family 9 protein n=1 Tax=Trinickia violacea TaxID=2571746 RepID=A0A4P8IYE5_9BURK|nr:tetratricopeptide repeat protein [Trinickia violacea]QCP54448.1 glycosyltransferase family 9 protein [Trinickia violacea]